MLTFSIQLIIIIMFSYCGNKIFFQLHDPEKCCVVTSSQKSLDIIVRAIESYDKQYEIVDVLDYKNKDLNERIKKSRHGIYL